MDFNDIQNAWNNEKTENVVVPNNLEKIQSVNTPLDKIKNNIKHEFYFQIIGILFIGALPKILNLLPRFYPSFYVLYAVFIAICIYYFSKLYSFYKRINTTPLNTKDNLYETYFDIRINMELYKSFSYALIPFMVPFLAMSLLSMKKMDKLLYLVNGDIKDSELIVYVFAIVVFLLMTGLIIEWWVNHYYGKYAKEIRKVIDDLKEE